MSTSELQPSPGSRSPLRLLQIVLGIISIFAGVLLGLLMVRGLILPGNLARDAWNISGVFVFCLLAVFLVWIGTRAVRRGRGRTVPKPTIRWGSMLGGVWLIFFSLHSHFHPGSNAYKAESVAESFGMLMGTLLMTAGGIMLIVSSLKAVWRKAHVSTSQTGFQG
jgi:Ca2+/Na+ antiporter